MSKQIRSTKLYTSDSLTESAISFIFIAGDVSFGGIRIILGAPFKVLWP